MLPYESAGLAAIELSYDPLGFPSSPLCLYRTMFLHVEVYTFCGGGAGQLFSSASKHFITSCLTTVRGDMSWSFQARTLSGSCLSVSFNRGPAKDRGSEGLAGMTDISN